MTDQPANSQGTPAIGYADALSELEQILGELESADVDVDRLAERVRRASELIRLCRTRIADARLHVEQMVSEIDGG